MTDLFIIEAPGKAKHLQELLKDVDIDAKVQATWGHLYKMPDALNDLGVDQGFRDFGRVLRDPSIGQRIRDEASQAERVYVATDADQEGDVIAWDVAELISDIHPEPYRVKLRGMDEESILEAIHNAAFVSKRDAVPGRTRAIVDRMIGSVFSQKGIAVGRVSSALLGLVDKNKPAVARMRLTAPSKQGGRPWVAECDIKEPLTHAIAIKLSKEKFPHLDASGQSKTVTHAPANLGDIMVNAGDAMDMSPVEVATSMQRLYEAGRMSYPRANSRGISRSVLRKIDKILKNSGYKFDEAVVPEKPEDDVHDAPYPVGKVEVQRDPKKQGFDEGLRTMVARDIIKSGQTHEIQYGIGDTAGKFLKTKGYSQDVCDFVAKLEWRRENGPRYPGQETWPENKITVRRTDTVLLQAAVEANLGRPSTWAVARKENDEKDRGHIAVFLERGLVDEDLNLTSKGRAWIAATPPVLLDPRISAAIEQACEKTLKGMMDDPGREPWEILSQKIISSLPEQVRQPLVAAVNSIPAHDKIDPTAMFQETTGLDDLLERSKDKTYDMGPRGPEFSQ